MDIDKLSFCDAMLPLLALPMIQGGSKRTAFGYEYNIISRGVKDW